MDFSFIPQNLYEIYLRLLIVTPLSYLLFIGDSKGQDKNPLRPVVVCPVCVILENLLCRNNFQRLGSLYKTILHKFDPTYGGFVTVQGPLCLLVKDSQTKSSDPKGGGKQRGRGRLLEKHPFYVSSPRFSSVTRNSQILHGNTNGFVERGEPKQKCQRKRKDLNEKMASTSATSDLI